MADQTETAARVEAERILGAHFRKYHLSEQTRDILSDALQIAYLKGWCDRLRENRADLAATLRSTLEES